MKAIVVHSGGMDSSICLALATREFGVSEVLSCGFDYRQRNSSELDAASKICNAWGVERVVINLPCLQMITESALFSANSPIKDKGKAGPASTIVEGRNGLMIRLAGILGRSRGAEILYTGVLGLEEENSGYRDCSREYMDQMEKILRMDFGNDSFEIRTPLVHLTKGESLHLAEELGVLDFLRQNTVTCYEGIPAEGCGKCPACKLRQKGEEQYQESLARS